MINIINGLLAQSINSYLICNTDECLSFIIVFLNLLTIFYLVYSSYKKITKLTRIFGYLWSCLIMCASIVVLVLHTCVFTIAGTVFTGMAIIAVLSMIFESKKDEKTNHNEVEGVKKDIGCYVIFPTTDNNFVFGLHNKKNELLALSKYKYKTIDQTKEAINILQLAGGNCEFEDLTQNWTIDAKHPKFKMYLKKQKYFFEFAAREDLTLLKSDAIDDAAVCLKMVKDARMCITSRIIYFATSKKDIKIGKKHQFYLPEQEGADKTADIDEEIDDINEDDLKNAKTLAESLKEIENVKSSNNVNKQTLYEYLNGKYESKVILNRRENQTKTGLPLADTYYTYLAQKPKNKKVCFAYVYENNGACLILAKLNSTYAKSLIKKKKSIASSKFPKTKQNDWYSIIVDDTFTEDEIHVILENAKEYCEK